MTWFTDSPFEKMMTQRPNGRRENAPSVSHAPACKAAPIRGIALAWGIVLERCKILRRTFSRCCFHFPVNKGN